MEMEEPIGCKCEVAPGDSDTESRRKGKKKKECCSGSSSRSTPSAVPSPTIEWPELKLTRGDSSGGGGRGSDATPTDPLPSLRTLLPALIDATTPSNSTSTQQRSNPFDLPPYAPAEATPLEDLREPQIVCSSAFVNEVFDGNGDCGSQCLCDTACGCRADPASAMEDDGTVEKSEGLDEIARLAEMGHFG